ncbi:hypothetical protein TWF506_009278 [Arthrobotrys conoides]|uniref:Uncharacterized protein n=1 Tax=Arthrobotrys conoides TaxID=74498 RepID=A0AAN8NC76_9PEZI
MAPLNLSSTVQSANRATSSIGQNLRDATVSTPCLGPFSSSSSSSSMTTVESVAATKYEYIKLRKREYNRFDIAELRADTTDLRFLVGKVITGWEPRLMSPKKFHSYCILFSVQDESPLVFVPQGPIFSRDIVFDTELYTNLPGNNRPGTGILDSRKIVDARWKIGKFWFIDGKDRHFHAIKMLGIKFEGMGDFGYLWSEFVDDGTAYCSYNLTRAEVMQIGQSEYESWKLATEGYPHMEEWSARRELPDGRYTHTNRKQY